MSRSSSALPLPPLELRRLVGPTRDAAFDNPSGELVFPYLDASVHERFFDFGCGCGRIARQLLQQRQRPSRYVGIDLHAGMIEWCNVNLAPVAPGFTFLHHDVYNYSFNPDATRPRVLPFEEDDGTFTLVNAWSVFTHLTQSQTVHYLAEVKRILAPDGVFHSTWLLFDKRDFPVLQPGHNALYVSDLDPGAVVIFDHDWVWRATREAGLVIYSVTAPAIRGFQWTMLMTHAESGRDEVPLPPDTGRDSAIVYPEPSSHGSPSDARAGELLRPPGPRH